MYPRIEDTIGIEDFIIKHHYEFNIGSAMDQVDKLDISDIFFPKGPAVLKFKDPFEFLDMLITRASIPFIIDEDVLNDKIVKIAEAIMTVIKLNKENIIQNDNLTQLIKSEYSSKFKEYIIKEIQANYNDINIDSKLDMIDKLQESLRQALEDRSIVDSDLIEVRSNYNCKIYDSYVYDKENTNVMQDSIMLADGSSL